MASTTIRLVSFSAGAVMVLTGCDPATADRPLGERIGGFFSGEPSAEAQTPAVGNGVVYTGEPRDIEAPEIFEVSDQGLWDGRPSLGGIWVAHPDVTEPQRVIMRNAANGKSVVGALFKRERENPGPLFQLSSDAAAELGVLAGSPVPLKVTALRKDETPAPALPLPQGPEAVDAGAPLPEENTTAAEPAAAPVVASAATAAPAAIQSTQLDTVAAAEAALAKSDAIVSGEAIARPLPAQRPQAAPVSDLAKPFLQVGIFSKQVNADATATRLASAGLSAEIREQDNRGQTIWRVLVGPAQTRADRTADLRAIRDLGFKDAYAVTN